LLEGIEIGPGWSDPIGLESFEDEFNFCTTHIWRG
jgi:hypothetical protein